MKLTIGLMMMTAVLLGCSKTKDESTAKDQKTSANEELNIILMVGDGMGVAQVSSAFYFGEDSSNFEQFETIGLSNTTSLSHLVTDSASGATAFSTGQKTYKRAIGVSVDTVAIPTILENLQDENYRTGLISLTSITHATPAAFYAHVKDRDMHLQIAEQLVESDIDFLAGGGKKYLSGTKGGLSFFEKLVQKKYHLDTLELGTPDLDRKNAFILAEDGLPSKKEGRGDFLPSATQKGLDYLSSKDQPFFMMIEGSYIDWGGHAMDDEMMIQEVLDFDKTLEWFWNLSNLTPILCLLSLQIMKQAAPA